MWSDPYRATEAHCTPDGVIGSLDRLAYVETTSSTKPRSRHRQTASVEATDPHVIVGRVDPGIAVPRNRVVSAVPEDGQWLVVGAAGACRGGLIREGRKSKARTLRKKDSKRARIRTFKVHPL
jgi:hypothetical protein